MASWLGYCAGWTSFPSPQPSLQRGEEQIGATESSAVGLSLNQFPLPYEERARVRD